MEYAQQGPVETIVYTEEEGLTGWTITLSGREIREETTVTIDMVVVQEQQGRVYLSWECPALTNSEYEYEVKSGQVIIDKGILRNGVV